MAKLCESVAVGAGWLTPSCSEPMLFEHTKKKEDVMKFGCVLKTSIDRISALALSKKKIEASFR